MTTESKKKCQSSGDVISNLTRDAIDNILTRLSLRDAVRTSILSRRWRYMWASIPYLVFDRDTFKLETTPTTQGRLLTAIYEVLLLYRGLMIVKFVLSLPGLKSCHQIDKLISFLSSKNCGLKEFTLHILEGDEPYKLPSSLFSLVELTRLSLQHCVIKPPIQFKGFNRLVSMEISKCSILPDVLSGLISRCPILEELKVTSLIPITGRIEISAPSLKNLFLEGHFASICFKYTPCLHWCLLQLNPAFVPVVGTYSNVLQSLHNLPAIKHLDLSYYYVGDKSYSCRIARKLPTTFNNLITLSLWEISFCVLHEVSNVLCLIRSSPNLEKIIVGAYAENNDALEHDMMPLFQVQEWSDVNLNSLREVEFRTISGTLSELGFIEILLAVSPKLEKMTITTYCKVTLTDRLEILTKVTCFPRASPSAKIIYKNEA